MERILVTGATGILGRELLDRLKRAGYGITAMSRRGSDASCDDSVVWVKGDLRSGEGVETALEGAYAVIHAATSPASGSRRVDLLGTQLLLDAARKGSIKHFVYPSIIGIDEIPLPYYRQKVLAERAVVNSGIPFTILRTTKFHPFVHSLLRTASRPPVMILPRNFREQPVDAGEVAQRLVDQLAEGPGYELPEFAGPEVCTYEILARGWQERFGQRKRVLRLPIPGRGADKWRNGATTNPARRCGRKTWSEWLQQYEVSER